MGERGLPTPILDIMKDDTTFEAELNQRLDSLAGIYRAALVDEVTIEQKLAEARAKAYNERAEITSSGLNGKAPGSSSGGGKLEAANRVLSFFAVTDAASDLAEHVSAGVAITHSRTQGEYDFVKPVPRYNTTPEIREIFSEGKS